MEREVWAEAYERFVHECRKAGQLQRLEGDLEKRIHPRFRMWSNIVWTTGDFQFRILDLSISGVAFDANQAFEPERRLVVRLSDLISVHAIVLESTPMDETPMFFSGRHRVRCRFEDTLEGLRFLVMVKDMQAIKIEV